MEELNSGFYKHYKGRFYKVYGLGEFGKAEDSDTLVGVGRHSEDLSEVKIYQRDDSFVLDGECAFSGVHVVYQACYYHPRFGDKAFWIRPEEIFSDEVKCERGRTVRFQYMAGLEDI